MGQPPLRSDPPLGSGEADIWNTAGFFLRSSTPMLELDGEGILRAVNPAARNLFGLPEAALVGRDLADFLDPFSREKAQFMLAQAAETGSAQDWELDLLQPGSLPRLVGFSADCLEEAPSSAGYVVICRDLTRQLDLSARLAVLNQELEGTLLNLEKAHRRLQDTQAQLVQSEKMRSLGQLVAGVAHEINNPLGFVKNNARFLTDKLAHLAEIARQAASGPLSPGEVHAFEDLIQDFRELSEENIDGLARIEQIVLALRSYSRLDETEFKQADLLDGLASTLRLVRANCDRRIQIVTEFEQLPLIECSPGELNQVFMNLLVNAVQSIQEAGLITVKAWAEQSTIQITIRDTGSGMPPEVLNRLGEPFFTTKPVGSGTGLGLAICMGILKRHNGRLQFSSQPGQGTLVTLEIPFTIQQERNL